MSQRTRDDAERIALVRPISREEAPAYREFWIRLMGRIARSVDADPLKAFGEVCRVELKAIRARV